VASGGWREARDGINTLPAAQFLAALRPKPGAAKHASQSTKKAAGRR